MTAATKAPAQNVLAAIMAHYWAILPESLETMIAVAERHSIDLEALERQRGEPLDNARTVTVREGVATIPATGPMFRYASFFNRISGATAYADIATDFAAAIDDPRVRAIILSIDSPGGEVNGSEELAAHIYGARGKKPIVAYVSHLGASAAYWLASAADRVVAAPTSLLGSIGTVVTVRKPPRDAMGGKTIEVVSSRAPNKRLDPESDAGRAQLLRVVDAFEDVFISRVAQYRGVSVETVVSDFGGGGVFVGQAAVDAGLADRVGDYESLHAELRDRGLFGLIRSPRASSTSTRSLAMDPKEGPKPADATVQPTPAQPDPAKAASATADQLQAARAEGIALGRTQERDRILAIQKLGKPGEEKVIAECVADAACSPGDAAVKLRAAEQQVGTHRLEQLRADEKKEQPKAAPTPDAPAGAAQAEATQAAQILSIHRQVTGGK